MALTNNETQAAFNERNIAIGRYRKEFRLTDSENIKMKAYLKQLRKDKCST
jgi:hypothetical protein